MKAKLVILGVIIVFGFIGCEDESKVLGEDDTQTLTCSLYINELGTELENISKVSYSGKYVTKVYLVQKIYSNQPAVLIAAKAQMDSKYEPFRKLDGHDITIKISGNTLTSTSIIDYTKADMSKVKDSLKKDGKIRIADMVKHYQETGFVCK